MRDHALLEWLGANSFRTSHYPYRYSTVKCYTLHCTVPSSEETLQLADKAGLLVVAECAAVSLDSPFSEELAANHRAALTELYRS